MGVWLAVLGVAFTATVGILFYFSTLKGSPTPSVVLVFQSDVGLKGAKATVQTPEGLLRGSFVDTGDKEFPFKCRFLLSPGEYSYTIMVDAVAYAGTVDIVDHARAQRITLDSRRLRRP